MTSAHGSQEANAGRCPACGQRWREIGNHLAQMEDLLDLLQSTLLTVLESCNRLSTPVARTDHHGVGRGGLPAAPE
jgi:hypothetical protein